MENNEKFHQELVEAIKTTKGIFEVNEYFENPNKYGDISTTIYFRCHIKSPDNFRMGEVSVDYRRKYFFIPDKGYSELKYSTTDIINAVKKHYKL